MVDVAEFDVALSFPGEYRERVRAVAEALVPLLGGNQKRILFDEFHEARLSGVSRDVYLPNLYRTQSTLVVVFLCPEYLAKRWTLLEFRHIRDLVGDRDAAVRERVMLLSFGPPGDVSTIGLVRGDIWIDVATRTAEAVAKLIVERFELNRPPPPPPPTSPPPTSPPPTPLPLDHQYAVISEWLSPGWIWSPGRWLLSEPLRRQAVWPLLMVGMMVLGAIVTWLSFRVDAACIAVSIANTNRPTEHEWLFYGYVAELGHAAWAMVGAAISLFLLGTYLKRVMLYLREAERRGRLVVDGSEGAPASVLATFAARNRRIFRLLTPALLVAAFGIVAVGESASWNARSFGWVQARAAASLEGSTLAELDVGVLPLEERICPSRDQCEIAEVRGGPRSTSQRRWYLVFVVAALALQAMFVFIGFYSAAKVVFFVWVHVRAVREMRNPVRPGTLKFRLDFKDKARRLGLGILDDPLREALKLAVLACAYFCLVSTANNEKGSRFVLQGFRFDLAHIAHFVGLLIVGLMIVAVFLFPLWYVDHVCHHGAVADRLAALESDDERQLLAAQRARPSARVAAFGVAALCLSIVIPIGLWFGSRWGPIDHVRQFLAHTAPAAACAVSGNMPSR